MYQLSFSIPSTGANASKVLSFAEISDWMHVVGTFDQGLASLYINGQLVATDQGSSTLVDSLHELYIGGASHPVSGAYNRDIDEVKIHNCPLTEQEVQALYQGDADGDGDGDGDGAMVIVGVVVGSRGAAVGRNVGTSPMA